MIEEQSYKRFREIFPDSEISMEQWKSEAKSIKISHQIAQYLCDLLFEASVGANRCPEFAEKLRAVLDWTVSQELQTDEDMQACLIEFDAEEDS